MTGAERLDIAEMRREIRDGFRELNEELKEMAVRIQSLELTRAEALAVAAERELTKAAYAVAMEKRLTATDRHGLYISQRVAWFAAGVGLLYGGIRLIYDIGLF